MIARARVQVTLEFDVDGLWGDDCTVGQVHKQAKDSAIQKIQNAAGHISGKPVIKSLDVQSILYQDENYK